jgi:Zn-finger nucleic acid-binding protein
MSISQGIEIDFCPSCRGVWLDRGELEKMIERSAMNMNSTPFNRENGNYNHHDNHYGHEYKKHHDDYDEYGNQRRHKKGFLSDLFDF